jgi:hypothetical protein
MRGCGVSIGNVRDIPWQIDQRNGVIAGYPNSGPVIHGPSHFLVSWAALPGSFKQQKI